jgi:hypothetical protein
VKFNLLETFYVFESRVEKVNKKRMTSIRLKIRKIMRTVFYYVILVFIALVLAVVMRVFFFASVLALITLILTGISWRGLFGGLSPTRLCAGCTALR